MEVNLCLGGVVFRLMVDRTIVRDAALEPFLCAGEKPDVMADMRWDWDEGRLPQTARIGEDALLAYFERGDGRTALTKAGVGWQACADYTPVLDRIDLRLNPRVVDPKIMNIGTLMRFLPMSAVFSHFGILFFHAAQISFAGKGILFTAPSGTGKTTQAKLWREHRGADLLCNDRTLIRRTEGVWRTYGYPLDGSEPVRSDRVTPLGSIVLLRQGPENRVVRLTGGRAIAGLMGQLVLDAWDAQAKTGAVGLLAGLLSRIPVYELTCTPDERAVACLEKKLKEDGVLAYGDN